MIFPRLFEFQGEPEEIDFSGISVAALRDDVIGVMDKYPIEYDSDVDLLISVDNNDPEDPITWDYLLGLKTGKYKKFLLNFLAERGWMDIEEDLKSLQKKRKKNPNYSIEEDLNLTHGDFWKYRLENYTKKEKKTGDSKSYSLDLDEPEYAELKDFFDVSGKLPELTDFVLSIPQSGDAFKFLKDFLRTLTDIIKGEKRIQIDRGSKSDVFLPAEKYDEWKEDMVEFIGKYEDPDELNEVYTSKVLKSGNFLNYLFKLEPKGIGRGEFLLAYAVRGCELSGGEDFDLIIPGKAIYEVKEYSDQGQNSEIRLGTHGKLSQFGFFVEIQNSIKVAKKIWDNFEPEELKKIVGSYNFRYWKYMVSDENFTQNPKALPSAVNSGELPISRLKLIINWHYLNHILAFNLTSEEEEELYTTAILRGNNLEPRLVKIEPIKMEKGVREKTIKISDLEKEDRLINELKSLKYIREPHLLIEDIENSPHEYFEKMFSKMSSRDIAGVSAGDFYFILYRPNKLKILSDQDFQFATISQSSVKIIEKGIKSGEITNINKAFDKYKSLPDEQDKDFIKFFRKEFQNESFYPRLSN